MDPFVAEIRIFPFNFAPKGWAFCDGQLLPISQNTALFSLLGTTYGGNGTSNFALPDLRGRVPISMGGGTGLQTYTLGQQGGVETVALAAAEMPVHTHGFPSNQVAALTATIPCKNAPGTQLGPAGSVLAGEASGLTATYSSAAPDSSQNTSAIVPAVAASNVGSGAAHTNIQPYLVLNYCIALQGIFPTRS